MSVHVCRPTAPLTGLLGGFAKSSGAFNSARTPWLQSKCRGLYYRHSASVRAHVYEKSHGGNADLSAGW